MAHAFVIVTMMGFACMLLLYLGQKVHEAQIRSLQEQIDQLKKPAEQNAPDKDCHCAG